MRPLFYLCTALVFAVYGCSSPEPNAPPETKVKIEAPAAKAPLVFVAKLTVTDHREIVLEEDRTPTQVLASPTPWTWNKAEISVLKKTTVKTCKRTCCSKRPVQNTCSSKCNSRIRSFRSFRLF